MSPEVGFYNNATKSDIKGFGPAIQEFFEQHVELNQADLDRTGFIAKKPNGSVTEIIPLDSSKLKQTVVADARKQNSVWFLVRGRGNGSRQHNGALGATKVREGKSDTGHS